MEFYELVKFSLFEIGLFLHLRAKYLFFHSFQPILMKHGSFESLLNFGERDIFRFSYFQNGQLLGFYLASADLSSIFHLFHTALNGVTLDFIL